MGYQGTDAVGGRPLFDGDSSTLNAFTSITAVAGGKLRVEALTVTALWSNDATASRCSFLIMKETATSAPVVENSEDRFDNSGVPARSSLTYCGSGLPSVNVGTGTTNSGGVGDSPLGAVGTSYTLPISDCVCPSGACRMYVVAENAIDSASVTCVELDDLMVSVKVSEDYP